MKRVFVIVCTAFFIFSSSFALAATMRIGLMAPLTGAFASEGEDMRRIVELLAEEVNKNGGIRGNLVEIVVQDDGSDARTAALAAQRLASSGVKYVIGTYGSAVTEASQTIYNRNKILQVATGSTAIRLSSKGFKLFFRTCPRDDEQGSVAVATINNMGFKNVAVVHDNSAYGKGLADEIKDGLEKSNQAKIVAFTAIQPNESDYNAILIRLKNINPDLIFFTGYYAEAGTLLRQMKGMNWQVPMIGGDATNNTDLVKIAGLEAVSGYHFVSPPMPSDLDSSQAKDFIAHYKSKYTAMPRSVWSVAAGDAFKVIVEGIKAIGEDPEAIADYLHNNFKDYEGLTGKIAFDQNGDRMGDLYRLYKVNEKGEFIMQ